MSASTCYPHVFGHVESEYEVGWGFKVDHKPAPSQSGMLHGRMDCLSNALSGVGCCVGSFMSHPGGIERPWPKVSTSAREVWWHWVFAMTLSTKVQVHLCKVEWVNELGFERNLDPHAWYHACVLAMQATCIHAVRAASDQPGCHGQPKSARVI